MTFRLKADVANGRVAVYDYPTADDNPYSDPLSYLSRIKYHSALGAIGRTATQTRTLSLASTSYNEYGVTNVHNLFSHGVSGGIPYIEGKITSIGGTSANIPLVGSVPVDHDTNYGCVRLLHLGADSTYVRIVEQYFTRFNDGMGVYTPFGSLSVGWEVWVTDLVL